MFAVCPHLHVKAILDGLKSEQSSKLLESIIQVRLDRVTIPTKSTFELTK